MFVLSIICGGKIVDKIIVYVKVLVYRSVQVSLVNCNICIYGGGDVNFFDVYVFCLSWFCFFQCNQQSFQVFFQFVSVKVYFIDGGVDDVVFVVMVMNLVSFSVFNCFSNVWCYSIYFWVWYQVVWIQNLVQLVNNVYCIWRSNNNVKVYFVFFDLVSQIFYIYQFCVCSFSSFSVCILGKYGYVNGMVSIVWQYSCITYVLVRFMSVDVEVNSYVYVFYEFSSCQFFQQCDSFVDVVLFGCINFFVDNMYVFGQFSYFLVFYYQVYGMCSIFDGVSYCFNVGISYVGSFGLCDFLQLSVGNFIYFVFVWFIGIRFDISCFFQQNCCWWGFGNESERMVSVNGDYYWNWQIFFDGISFCVECFVEFYDVYVLLIQSWIYWWIWVSYISCNLQFDIGLYFFSYYKFFKLGNNVFERFFVI